MPPKKKPGAEPPAQKVAKERQTAPVQIDRKLVEMLNVIAAHRGESANTLITPLIRQWIVTQYELVARAIDQRVQEIRDE
jgi:predicted HicB family RNase H-like nuclease